jgi:Putative MetA-pathway of phenol degradation
MKTLRYVPVLLLLVALAALGTAGIARTAGAVSEPKGGPEARENEALETIGPIITNAAVPVDKGELYLQSYTSLSSVTGLFNPHGKRISAGGTFHSFGNSLQITYGVWDNFEVFTVIPVLANWATSVNKPGPNGERAASHAGLGDLDLTLKYRLVKEGPVAPTISALFATDFPSGHYKHLNPGRLGTDALGTGSYTFTTGLNLSKWVKPFIFYGNLYYSMPTTTTSPSPITGAEVKTYPRDFVTVNLAAEYPFNETWTALLELTSYWDGGRLFGPGANVAPAYLLSILPGFELRVTKKLYFSLGVNINLIGRNTVAEVTPILSLAWKVH